MRGMKPNERLKAARKAAGFRFASEAARHMRVEPPTYLGHENGSRKFDLDAARLYGRHFNVTPAWLIGEGADAPPGADASHTYPDHRDEAALTIGLPVVGEVAAGAWLDPEEMDEPRVPQVFVPPDPRFPLRHQRVWIVRGRSVERTAEDGAALVCVVADDGAPVEPRHGDLVIAERRRHQGGLIERTAKRLRITRNRAELVPEYRDEALNIPVPLGDADDPDAIEVRIVAVVIGIYKPLRAP